MAFDPHYRLTMSGTMGGAVGLEIFTMGLALAKRPDAGVVSPLDPNDTVWDDVRTDCEAFFARPATGILSNARLRLVKIAPIGADGRYSGPPAERTTNTPGGIVTTFQYPFQTSMACSLGTEGDLGRVKGRFYLPQPSAAVEPDGRISEANAEAVEGSLKAFVDALNNQPGLDVLDLRVCVASQGRRNKDGSVRLGPDNHVVTEVSVGRRLDVIRRRANKTSESHIYRPVADA